MHAETGSGPPAALRVAAVALLFLLLLAESTLTVVAAHVFAGFLQRRSRGEDAPSASLALEKLASLLAMPKKLCRALMYAASYGDARVTCPVCFEEKRDHPWEVATSPCCSGKVCWACLHAHVTSVVSDNRSAMQCVHYPCAEDLSDALVHKCFQRVHYWRWTGSERRREVAAYERWSLMNGLAKSCQARNEDIIPCPGADCDMMWVMPEGLRRQKLENEPHHPWSPRSWSFFYAPPKDGDAAGAGGGGAGAGLPRRKSAGATDPRFVWCESCQLAYCILCRRRWTQSVRGFRPTPVDLRFGGGRYVPPQESHDGLPCCVFAGRFLKPGGDEAAMGEAVGAKACPKCRTLVARSAGCNHMICVCGAHWCFVCGTAWSRKHYSCRDEDGDTYKGRGADNAPPECVVA